MNIIVCLKVVKSELVSLSQQHDSYAINPYDMYALKDVLRIKNNRDEAQVECKISCLSMGAEKVEDCILRCVASGADEAVLLSDSRFAGADTVATSYTLYKGINKIGVPSLIVCGHKSIDGETGLIANGLAKRFNVPCVTNVERIEKLMEDEVAVIVSDDNEEKVIKARLPIVLAYNNFTTEDLEISLLKLKNARRKGIVLYNLEDIEADEKKCGMLGSYTKVVGLNYDKMKKTNCKVIDGELNDKVNNVMELLNPLLNEMR